MRTPVGWDPTTLVDIIIVIDGSVTFGVGYHSWLVSTADEDILLQEVDRTTVIYFVCIHTRLK
jgi:hypothetical protein